MTEPLEPPKPTAQVQIYVDVLGHDLAIDFLLRFGGAEQHFAMNPRQSSDIVEAIGLEKARELGRRMSFGRKRVPTAKPWLALALKSKGLSGAKISRKLHTTDVTVRKWLNTARSQWDANPAQLSLFSEDP